MIFKVLMYGNRSHCLPSCWTKHYVNTAKQASYIKEIKHKGIVLFIVNAVWHEYKYIGDAKETKWQVESALEYLENCWQN